MGVSSSCWVNNILRQKYSNNTSEGAQTARRKEPSYITQREPKRTTRSFGSSSLASTAARVRNKFSDQEGRSNEIILLLTITGAFVRLSPYAPALIPHERTSVKLRSRRDSIYREGKPCHVQKSQPEDCLFYQQERPKRRVFLARVTTMTGQREISPSSIHATITRRRRESRE